MALPPPPPGYPPLSPFHAPPLKLVASCLKSMIDVKGIKNKVKSMIATYIYMYIYVQLYNKYNL